jgi:DNA-binding beta-propeller fold protein YncE
MSSSRVLFSTLITSAAVVLAGCAAEAGGPAAGETMVMGNPITGEGLPNPAPTVTANWGQIPAGVPMGTSAGMDIDPIDGNLWTYERCGQGAVSPTPPPGAQAGGGRQGGGGGGGGFGGANCDSPDPTHKPVYKLDVNTGAILANFGEGVMVTPHGIGVDPQGNVWVTDFAQNPGRTKGHQVHKFSPEGQLLMSLGRAGQAGNADGQFNQPNDVIVAPDGSIFVSDGHDGQGMTTMQAIEEGIANGSTARISKFSADGTFIKSWGGLGLEHGQFRTPHSMAFDSRGRLWIADRGNHRIEIYDQEGNYLESRYTFGRISGVFITPEDMVYAIDSESSPLGHQNWVNGVRVANLNEDRIIGFIPPFMTDRRYDGAPNPAGNPRLYQGAAGEGIAVDRNGNVFAGEGPNSMQYAGGPWTKYSVAAGGMGGM